MRIVIKIGTSTLAHSTGRLNIRRIEQLCKVMSDLKNSGHEIILVSSGAIGMGVGKLGLGGRPEDIASKQAAAAVGQCELMYVYDKLFAEYNHTVGQLLITGIDIENERHRKNFENTLYKLLELGALPIINENDTVSTDEIEIGDNDTLSAIIASSINAELLVLLSDINGLYNKNPKTHPDAEMIELYNKNPKTHPDAEMIEVVRKITPDIVALSDGKGVLGTGGMATKIKAAELVTKAGCDMVIANGAYPKKLYDIVEGKPVGTRFIKENG